MPHHKGQIGSPDGTLILTRPIQYYLTDNIIYRLLNFRIEPLRISSFKSCSLEEFWGRGVKISGRFWKRLCDVALFKANNEDCYKVTYDDQVECL